MAGALEQRWFGEDWRYMSANAPTAQNHTLDANNDALAFIFQTPEAAVLTRGWCRLGAITGTTPTYRLSLQGVATNGQPDGTIKGATNNALVTFSPSGLSWGAGTGHWLNFGESYTCTRGELLALVIDYSSGTVDGSNNATFTYNWTGTAMTSFPRAMTNNAGSWSTQTQGIPVWGYGSASKAYGRPAPTIGSVTINNASSPREVGMKWTAPAGWGATYKVAGVDALITTANVTASLTLRRYTGGGASDTTAVEDVAISQQVVGVNSQRIARMRFDESSLTALNYGDAHRIAFENGGSASNTTIRYYEVDSADDLDAFPGGQNVYWTQRDSGGNWSDNTLRRMFDFALLIDDITEPSSGGILTHPGMSGGCRG